MCQLRFRRSILNFLLCCFKHSSFFFLGVFDGFRGCLRNESLRFPPFFSLFFVSAPKNGFDVVVWSDSHGLSVVLAKKTWRTSGEHLFNWYTSKENDEERIRAYIAGNELHIEVEHGLDPHPNKVADLSPFFTLED